MEKTYNVKLTATQLKLLNHFMEELSDSYGNNSCNDLPNELIDLFTKEEGLQVAKEFEVYNNPEHPDGPSWPLPDFCLLAWLKHKINEQCK